MPRNMSCAITTNQVKKRIKNVTRRMGWTFLEPGDTVQLVEKAMGLKKGEKIKKLCLVRIIRNDPEPLRKMVDDPEYGRIECVREGFPGFTPMRFLVMFCRSHKGCMPETVVNRIEWEYID